MAITRRAVLKGALVAGAGALAGAGAYGYAYERHALEVTRATVPVAGLPPALAGLRIGLITDIHRSLCVSHDDVSQAVNSDERTARSDRARRRLRHLWRSRLRRALRRRARPLAAPHGVFGILGNHDDDHDMPAALERTACRC